MAVQKKKKGSKRVRTRSKASGGGMLMGMRSGFRKMTGSEKSAKALPMSPLRRAIIIGVGVVIVFALVWGLAQR